MQSDSRSARAKEFDGLGRFSVDYEVGEDGADGGRELESEPAAAGGVDNDRANRMAVEDDAIVGVNLQ